jgi:hypothetical protein
VTTARRSLNLMRRIITTDLLIASLMSAVPLTASTVASATSEIPTCSYRQLEVAVAWGPGAAAGNLGIPFIIINISRSTCSLKGYPRLLFAPSAYKKRTIKVNHLGGMIFGPVSPRLIVIKPGADASFGLDYGDASNQQDPNGAPCMLQNIYVALPVRSETFNQNFETTVNFNFCFADFQVGITSIQAGPLPKEG